MTQQSFDMAQELNTIHRDERVCHSCECPRETPEGIVDFIGNYCESCHDRMELGRIEAQESARNGDHDFSMNY